MTKIKRTDRMLLYLIGAAILIVASLHLLKIIVDPDFFWHLKTGEWIWQHRSLPHEDPFSYTSLPELSESARFTLTAYWLSQIIYHLLYSSGGMEGIVAMRVVLTAAIIFTMFTRREGDRVLYAGLALIFVSILLDLYPVERPQVFSFLLFGILLYCLDRIRRQASSRSGFGPVLAVPLLMLLWANLHGGYVLGQVTLVLYGLMEGIKFLHPSLRPSGREAYLRLLLACGLGTAFSLMNPNSFHAALTLSHPDYLFTTNSEYRSTLTNFREFASAAIAFYWVTVLFAAVALIASGRMPDITIIALLAGTGYFSLTQTRYIAFFLVSALPFIGKGLSEGKLLKWSRLIILPLAFISALYLTWDDRVNLRMFRERAWIDTFAFPVKAADFVTQNDVRGNLFNTYKWGGFLIWKLGPERKVFTDGRVLYPEMFLQGELIMNASDEKIAGVPLWKALLDVHAVRTVILPIFTPSGTVPPLLYALLEDRGWAPVFFHLNSVVFVKDTPENGRVVGKFAIPRGRMVEELIRVCDHLIRLNPGNFRFYVAKGDLYARSSQKDMARLMYEKAQRLAPFSATIRERLGDLAR